MKCKYKKREHQISYDGGQTWTTDQIIKGDLIEAQSPDCPDDAYIDRWIVIDGAYLCDGKNKYKKEAYQVSYNGGLTWYYSTPVVYRLGDFVAYDENFCNNFFVGHYEISDGRPITRDPLKIIKSIGQTELTSSDVRYYNSVVIDNLQYDAKITSCTIGDSVTSIGSSAFNSCSGLTSVDIPNSVTSIGNSAFHYCYGLTTATIGSGVTSIDNYAFSYCNSLTSVDIPSGVTSISNSTFYGCSSLSSATIPNSVTTIGESAFTSCGLITVTIPDSVTSIGHSAFRNCYSLTSATIGNSVTSIGAYTFSYCYHLSSVTIGNSVTTIGNYAFEKCSGLTSITIPDSVTSIGDYDFYNCRNLTSVTVLATTPPSLAGMAFYNTSANFAIYVPAESVQVYKSTFPWSIYADSILCMPPCGEPTGDSKWYAVYIGGSTLYEECDSSSAITSGEIQSHSLLISVEIGNCVTSIGRYAFSGCTNLTSVTIPNSVTSIGYNAFEKCSGLTSITIPDSVTSIGDSAFTQCTYLSSLTIGDSVTSIGRYAFWSCYGLTSVTIPSGVTSIGGGAFGYCHNLTSITCLAETPPSLGVGVFDGTSYSKQIYVPAQSVEAYKSAGRWSDYASRIQPIPTP